MTNRETIQYFNTLMLKKSLKIPKGKSDPKSKNDIIQMAKIKNYKKPTMI